MSTTEADRPSMCAAMPRIEAVVVTPVPPIPVKTMFSTSSMGSNAGIGVESTVKAGRARVWVCSPPSTVTNDGQNPSMHE